MVGAGVSWSPNVGHDALALGAFAFYCFAALSAFDAREGRATALL